MVFRHVIGESQSPLPLSHSLHRPPSSRISSWDDSSVSVELAAARSGGIEMEKGDILGRNGGGSSRRCVSKTCRLKSLLSTLGRGFNATEPGNGTREFGNPLCRRDALTPPPLSEFSHYVVVAVRAVSSEQYRCFFVGRVSNWWLGMCPCSGFVNGDREDLV